MTIPIKRTRHFVSVLVVAVKLIWLWEHVGSFLDACSHIFVFNAHSLRIEHETGSVTATMNVSIVDVDDKLAFSVISTIYTVSMLIYAVEFVLSRRIVFIITVFRALIAGTTQFTLFIITQFTSLNARTACSAAFHIGSSATFKFPLEVENG